MSMNMTQTKFTVKHLPARESVIIEGGHGRGKSECVAQICAELSKETGKPHILIDIRLSQRETGDVIGMPRSIESFTATIPTFVDGVMVDCKTTVANVMVHDLPVWFPRDPDACGILFLDEIHYASKELIQAVMELSLDYRLNMVPLPAGFRVIAAGNQVQDTYGGTTLNPAAYSRFFKILFEPTAKEWQDWAKDNGVIRPIVKYLDKFPKDLDPPDVIEPGQACPDRRSWTKLSRVCQHMAELGTDPVKDLDYLTLLAVGYLGTTTAVNFVDYVRKEYKVYTAEDILNKLTDDMLEDIKSLSAGDPTYCTGISKEIAEWVEKQPAAKLLSDKQSANLAKYLQAIPEETASGFWTGIATASRTGKNQIATTWYTKTKGVKEYIGGKLNRSKATA
jgi:hypothetical protein